MEPLLRHLREHAPQRAYTYWLLANQEILKGNYVGAVRTTEEFEALTPWVPDSIGEIKRAAQESLSGSGAVGGAN